MTSKMQAGRAFRAILALAVLGLLFPTLAATQEKQAGASKKPTSKNELVTTKAAQGPQEGQDPNIKNDVQKNNPKMTAPPPPEKGGKARGAGPYPCRIHVDNRTPWFIQVYVDGEYRGTVNRYGDLAGLTGNGPTTLYGVAYFYDAPTQIWGPQLFSCPAYGSYTWQMLR